MTKTIQLLSILAVIQIVLIAAIWLQNDPLQGSSQQTTLLTFNPDEINRIVINDQESSVQLNKVDAKWQTSDKFPADNSQVNALLGKLTALKYGLPVATTSAAISRFKVSEDNFERLIQLHKDDKVIAQLYLGSGAGARRSHARNADQDGVFSISMASYDAPAKLNNWYDKTVLQFNKDEVTGIELDQSKFQKQQNEENKEGSIWKSTASDDNHQLEHNAIEEGLSELSGLRFNEMLGVEKKAAYNLDKPELTLSLAFQEDKSRSYQFAKKQDSEDYILKVSDREEYFQFPSYAVKTILEKFSPEPEQESPSQDDQLSEQKESSKEKSNS